MTARALLPPGVLEQHVIALGKTRAGKSSKLRVLVEQLLRAGEPTCVIDPKGDWWGLKSSADGKRAGFPVVIFGGEHADVPINEHSGAHVAELIATGNRPALIDLGGWMVGPRTRFFIAFASTFFKLTRGRRYLVIDEVHNFAPQGKILSPEAGESLHWANRLASEGSGKGVTIIAASQRPQKVHKDFLTSCETLIACRVIHKLDRDAIKDWIDGCADPALGKRVLAELAGMKRPEAWVWSPEIDYGPELVTFPMFETYDSFKPQAADIGRLKGWADVDLEEVKTKLAAVVQEAEANDPRKLKTEIVRLQKLISSASNEAPKVNTAELGQLRERCAGLEQHRDLMVDALGYAQDQLDQARRIVGDLSKALEKRVLVPAYPTTVKPSAPARAVAQPLSRTNQAAASAPRIPSNTSIERGQHILLTAIAQYGDAGVDREQLFVLTGYKSTSIDTYIKRLRGANLITSGWPVVATAAGLEALGDFQPLPTGPALLRYWLERLSEGERRVLDAIVDTHPESLSKPEIGARTGYKATSVDTYMKRLRARRLVLKIGNGSWVADERLF